ncbi:hypothetical protein LOTGIDRAFT_167418 [Lottia gigantea]|uniref:Uncharacterized protein n=1 Tax=Lottia gigantea TaxID=225164 RepID=V4BB20_LOTGI|nr:hypothetical protein LOTGIDRAFT_167418 [Lottia gigantea]ESO86184.1 hypothetical protein LOTGIDRAFT_167418 [Lottia gigantea]
MVLEAGSNPIETIKHPDEFDTMLKTVLYPKNYDSVSGWIPDVGNGEVLKEPVRTVADDADLARIRVVARNTLERVTRGVNHGFEKRALQYNNVVENNRWAAAGATAGGAAGIAKTVNDKKAEAAANAEARRHNLAMEREARGGSGVGDILGTVKEFGQRFGEETKKTVKEGLSKLIDKIDTGEMKISILCISTQQHQSNRIINSYYLPKKDVQDIFQYYEGNEEEVEIKDIIENFIKSKNPSFNPTDIKVFLTKNVNDLDLSNIDSNRKNLILFDDCVAQRNQTVQQEFFTKGRHHNCHCIYQSQSQSFYGMDSMFIRKNANCFLLFELNDKDLSQIIQSINHGMDRDTFKKVCKAQRRNPDDHGYVFVNTRKPAGERVMIDIC